MRVQFIAVSQNAKTGPIPASIVERASCWPGCALYENGCYAESGALAMHWDRVSRDLAGGSWSEFCDKVAALPSGRLWRYAQAGDLPGHRPRIDGTLLEELVRANAGKNVIAFTHKPVLGKDPVAVQNRRLIAAAIGSGFTINLSADNPARGQVGRIGHSPCRDRPYPGVCAPRSPAPVQETARRVGREHRRMAKSNRLVAAEHAGGRANCSLPGDLFGRDLQDLRRVCPNARCRDRLPSPRQLATGRSRYGRPRCPSGRKLGFSGTQDYG